MRKKSNIDYSLSACCGVKPIRIAGIRRCAQCEREIIEQPYGLRDEHMFDVHDRHYQNNEDQ